MCSSDLMRFKLNPLDGSIARLSVEFVRFFERGYYQNFIKSDAKARKPLTLKT